MHQKLRDNPAVNRIRFQQGPRDKDWFTSIMLLRAALTLPNSRSPNRCTGVYEARGHLVAQDQALSESQVQDQSTASQVKQKQEHSVA